jgi:hypothetical protein
MQKSLKKINANLQLVAKIINGTVKYKYQERVVEGIYKGRKIYFSYIFRSVFGDVSLTIIPKSNTKKFKGFMMSYPKPTKNTEFLGKNICWRNLLNRKVYFRNWTENDIIKALEEATKAAEIVETNAPFYKN